MGWKSGSYGKINIGKIAGEKGIKQKHAGKNGKNGENKYAFGFRTIKNKKQDYFILLINKKMIY